MAFGKPASSSKILELDDVVDKEKRQEGNGCIKCRCTRNLGISVRHKIKKNQHRKLKFKVSMDVLTWRWEGTLSSCWTRCCFLPLPRWNSLPALPPACSAHRLTLPCHPHTCRQNYSTRLKKYGSYIRFSEQHGLQSNTK